jgi:hypothetical protein
MNCSSESCRSLLFDKTAISLYRPHPPCHRVPSSTSSVLGVPGIEASAFDASYLLASENPGALLGIGPRLQISDSERIVGDSDITRRFSSSVRIGGYMPGTPEFALWAVDSRLGDYALAEIHHEPRSGCWTERRLY